MVTACGTTAEAAAMRRRRRQRVDLRLEGVAAVLVDRLEPPRTLQYSPPLICGTGRAALVHARLDDSIAEGLLPALFVMRAY